MPHSRQGGRRTGTPGTAYANRRDLNRHLPVQAPTGMPYGEHQASIDSQRAVPLPAAPSTAPPAPTQPAPAPFVPGQLGPLDRPTERPDEPLTAGMPFGPGAGPEALGMGGPVLGRPLSQVIADAAASSGAAELAQLAQRARNLGQ